MRSAIAARSAEPALRGMPRAVQRSAQSPGATPAHARAWRHLALHAQPKLRVSAPADPAEAEADRVAGGVMRMPEPVVQRACAACSAGGATCPQCQEDAGIQRKGDGAGGGAVGSDFASGLGAGTSLDSDTRAFFEPRLGRDLGQVRVHADARADAAVRSIDARAFTLGRDVAFAAGEYEPGSARGRELLAHELVHVVQQGSGAARIQRSLQVDPARPTDPQDPLSRLGPAAFRTLAVTEMGAVVHQLCDRFNVDGIGNVVGSPPDVCDDRDAVATGGNPIGCCCLCALAGSGSGPWTIHVTGIGGPRTTHAAGTPGGDFFLHPRNSAFEFGAWGAGGAREVEDPVVVAGHELCGHGALLERGLHPESVERVDTNVHDPTVRIENLIRAEQGLPGSRGLAADPHRGESFARVTVRDFPFNGTSTAGLPAAERDKIQLAKDFINANNTWVDLFGHSDLVGSPAAKLAVSQARADNMRSVLTTGTRPVSPSISKTFRNTGPAGTGTITVSGNRFTKIEGRSDFDAIAGAAPEDLRRVDIVMPTRPAGAEVPIAGTPTAVAPVGPESLGTFLARRFFGNACDRLLARSAWF